MQEMHSTVAIDKRMKEDRKAMPFAVKCIVKFTKSPSIHTVNGNTTPSQKGTTQGVTWQWRCMGVALLPLTNSVKSNEIVQKRYADDGNVVRSSDTLFSLHKKVGKTILPDTLSRNAT